MLFCVDAVSRWRSGSPLLRCLMRITIRCWSGMCGVVDWWIVSPPRSVFILGICRGRGIFPPKSYIPPKEPRKFLHRTLDTARLTGTKFCMKASYRAKVRYLCSEKLSVSGGFAPQTTWPGASPLDPTGAHPIPPEVTPPKCLISPQTTGEYRIDTARRLRWLLSRCDPFISHNIWMSSILVWLSSIRGTDLYRCYHVPERVRIRATSFCVITPLRALGHYD